MDRKEKLIGIFVIGIVLVFAGGVISASSKIADSSRVLKFDMQNGASVMVAVKDIVQIDTFADGASVKVYTKGSCFTLYQLPPDKLDYLISNFKKSKGE